MYTFKQKLKTINLPDGKLKDLSQTVVQHVCLKKTHFRVERYSSCFICWLFLFSFSFFDTLDSQWAAISSNGAFWNFSISWRLFSRSCSSRPVVSDSVFGSVHFGSKVEGVYFVVRRAEKCLPMAFLRVAKVISSASCDCWGTEQEPCCLHTWTHFCFYNGRIRPTLSGRLLGMMSTCREMVSTKLFLLVSRSSSAGQQLPINPGGL